MTSRDRILGAMRGAPVEYLPCSIYFNPNLKVSGYRLTDWGERSRLQMDLGADPLVDLRIGLDGGRDIVTRCWIDDNSPSDGPVLFNEYQTPAGRLRMAVRKTPEWPPGMDIPWGDDSASHLVEPLIKTPDDVDVFACIWRPPDSADLAAAQPGNECAREYAEVHDLAVRGYAGNGLATLMFVMGAENMVTFAVDYPEAFARLAQIDSRGNIARIQLSAQAGADVVKRFGGYEQTNFLSPAIFRQVVVPLLRQEVAAAHAAGVLIYYRVVSGMGPLLADIAEIGFDCIEGGEPRLSQCSLVAWHDALAGKTASWTGVSTPVLLGGEDPDAVRREVRHCAEVFGRRGFILGVTNSIRNHFPWKNTLAMIDAWKEIR